MLLKRRRQKRSTRTDTLLPDTTLFRSAEGREPGLHMKVPFIQNVVYYDNRVLDFAPPAEEIIASDQKRFVVDAFARFRIVEPLKFYQAVQTEAAARNQLRGDRRSSRRRVIGNRTLFAVSSQERRGGKECVCTGRERWGRHESQKKNTNKT